MDRLKVMPRRGLADVAAEYERLVDEMTLAVPFLYDEMLPLAGGAVEVEGGLRLPGEWSISSGPPGDAALRIKCPRRPASPRPVGFEDRRRIVVLVREVFPRHQIRVTIERSVTDRSDSAQGVASAWTDYSERLDVIGAMALVEACVDALDPDGRLRRRYRPGD